MSPEVEPCLDGVVGVGDVQAGEAVLWIAVGGAFVEVTVPLDHYADGATLKKQNLLHPRLILLISLSLFCFYTFCLIFLTYKCGHVLEVVSSSSGDVAQAKDGAVGVELLVISASLQIGLVGGL